MKKYAFFLPQFYEIEENNKWWGKGFTEWTNIKKAQRFYKEQVLQKPLNDNYYNLLDKDTMRWQTKVMHDYSIDGLIYYHYYFGKGKMIMEKPAENLLKWRDVDQSFFFCWANHSFTKGWPKKEILVKQEYGDRDDWEKHFNYMLQFFKDPRYLKENNKPLFMLFKSDFEQKNRMMSYFDSRCKEEGFNGICVIESYHGNGWPNSFKKMENEKTSFSRYVFIREPAFETYAYKYAQNKIRYFNILIREVLCKLNISKKIEIFNGNELLNIKMNSEPKGSGIIHGISFQWDNTARHGRKGYVITPIDKEKFYLYMNRIGKEKYLFINAWNEWSEGMVLEPTDVYKYKYLEWIKEWEKTNDKLSN